MQVSLAYHNSLHFPSLNILAIHPLFYFLNKFRKIEDEFSLKNELSRSQFVQFWLQLHFNLFKYSDNFASKEKKNYDL